MLCQKCNKNKASVYYNKIVNGEKQRCIYVVSAQKRIQK